jgi:hypothetical protein
MGVLQVGMAKAHATAVIRKATNGNAVAQMRKFPGFGGMLAIQTGDGWFGMTRAG